MTETAPIVPSFADGAKHFTHALVCLSVGGPDAAAAFDECLRLRDHPAYEQLGEEFVDYWHTREGIRTVIYGPVAPLMMLRMTCGPGWQLIENKTPVPVPQGLAKIRQRPSRILVAERYAPVQRLLEWKPCA